MSVFRRLMYGKRQGDLVDNSEWVFFETAPPPSSPPPDDAYVVVPNIEKPIPPSNPGPPPPPPLHGDEPTMPMHGAPPPPPPPPGGNVPPAPPSGRVPAPPPPPPPPPPGATAPPPPPPGGRAPGPPPPPPPGLGGWRGRGRGVPDKKSNLKPLHWSKLSRAVKDSLWEELQRPGEPPSFSEFDISELETLFSNSPKRPTACSSRPEKIQLIGLRRANNTESMLTKIKMPLPDLVAAVLDLDEEILDVDQVENILKFCPTKEEMDQLKNYTGDIELLGKCEHFFLELMKVPRMEAKLNCFMFKIQFKEQLEVFKKSLDIVNSACDEVLKSHKFKEIMKRILYLMNTLNQGIDTGAADGFKLDTLLKLTDTQSSTSGMTLMHYLCKVLASKLPTLIDFHEDLLSLEAATKIKLKYLGEEMESLISGVKKVKQELDASANDGPVSRSFCTTVKEFVGQAEAEVTNVTNFYFVVRRHADELALYFGEDPAHYPFEQVTQTLLNFVNLFKKCYEENLEADELERKKAENAEMEKAKGINLTKKGGDK